MKARQSITKALLATLALASFALAQDDQQWQQQQWQQQQQQQGQQQQSYSAPREPGNMEDLSPFPTVQNSSTFQERYGGGGGYGGWRQEGGGGDSLNMRPALRVQYDVALNFSSPWHDVQVYKMNIVNDGPGDVAQLAVKIEDWNTTSSYWGLDSLDGNDTFQYLPKYRSPLRTGDVWTFGFIQNSNLSTTWPLVEPLYGQTADGRFFNSTNIIPSPANPPGTNATLIKDSEQESWWKDQRWVIWSGKVQNTGLYPINNVGLDIVNITQATGTWHLVYDPVTNTSYLPLRDGPLQPKASQHFGFIMPLASGYPNVSLHHVTTPNALYNLTAPNLYTVEKPREAVPPGLEQGGTTLEQSSGGLTVPFPPTHVRPQQAEAGNGQQGGGGMEAPQQQQGQQGQEQQGQQQGGEQMQGAEQMQGGEHQQYAKTHKGYFPKKKKIHHRLRNVDTLGV